MSDKKTYLEGQKKRDLREDDVVRVQKQAASGEKGWDNDWAEPMNNYIGKKFRVKKITKHGVRLTNVDVENKSFRGPFEFPYFVLRRTFRPPAPIDMGGGEYAKQLGADTFELAGQVFSRKELEGILVNAEAEAAKKKDEENENEE